VDSANRGAAAARGRILVFLNNDTAVRPGWLDALVAALDGEPDAGIVGARLLGADGRLQESGGILWRDASGWNFGRGDHPDRPEYRRRRDVDYCSGACLAIPRALFASLGGFDARYRPAYYEDADLAFRVRAAGKRVVVEPASTVVHFEGASAGTDLARGMKRHQLVNRERFAERWAAELAQRPEPPPASDARRAPYLGARAHVLVIESRVPDPAHDAGSLRLVRLCDLLAELGCTVTLVPHDRALPSAASSALERRGVEVFTRSWLRSIPAHLRERGSLYDVVWISRKHLAAKYVHHVRRHAPKARIVFDTVDLHFVRESRQLAVAGRPSPRRAERLEREEIALVRACDATLVVSEAERALLLAAAPDADVHVVSTLHELHPPGPDFAERSGGVFVGSFEHAPNVDAMRWYLDDIHARVLARCPDFTLRVIGTDAPAWLRDWRGPGVEVVGAVRDLAPEFARARLGIAPLRFGAGVKGKINTSHSYGVPTVATRLAAEGMHLVDGASVLLADDPDAFAAAVARLHGDAALWARVADGARRNVQEWFSVARARAALGSLLAALDR
jgi:glycosyltransferase involved in cell wall biosynthesis